METWLQSPFTGLGPLWRPYGRSPRTPGAWWVTSSTSLQLGSEPEDWKPLPSVGAGVSEIRVHTEVEHRVFYVAKFPEGVYVLHAFEKRTQKTRQADIELGRRRLGELVRYRREAAARRRREER
jgi:phage-related protein